MENPSSHLSRCLIPGLNRGLLLQRVSLSTGSGAAGLAGTTSAAAAAEPSNGAAAQTRRRTKHRNATAAASEGLHPHSASGAAAVGSGGGLLTSRTAYQRNASVRQSVISSKALPPHWQGPAEPVLDRYAAEARAALGRSGAAAAKDDAPPLISARGISMHKRQQQEQQQRRRRSGNAPPRVSTASGRGASRRTGTAGSLRGVGGSAAAEAGASPRAYRGSEAGSQGEGLEEDEDMLLSHVLMVRVCFGGFGALSVVDRFSPACIQP